MREETKREVLLAARKVVSRKGYDCSLREIATEADVSYGHVHRSFGDKDQLLKEAEEFLVQQIKSSLGEGSSVETISILLVKIWYSLQSVTDSREFLLQTLKPNYPKFKIPNELVSRLTNVCLIKYENDKQCDPNVVAVTLYMIALSSDPVLLKGASDLFDVDLLPEELSISYLNSLNKYF